MLATMRSTQVLHTSLPQSQPSSTPVSRTSSAHSNNANGRHLTMNSNKTAAARGKKTDAATVIAQTTPGLLTLSRPLDSATDVSGDEARSKSSQRRGKKKKKSALAIDDLKAEDGDALSRSAPNATTDWAMPQNKKQVAATTESSGLTWQQELLNGQASQQQKPAAGKEKKKTVAAAGKKEKSKTAAPKHAAPSTDKNDSLTWQQELLGSNQFRGQTFDVFADARDAQTFGSNTGGAPPSKPNRKERGAPRQRADSAGEMGLRAKAAAGGKKSGVAGAGANVHLGSNSGASSSSAGPPSTPNKLAYAGPNFHNSPSPASLPVPKFLQSKSAAIGSSGTGSTTPSNQSLFAREAHYSTNHQDPNASVSSASDSSSDEDPDASFTHSVSAQNNRFVRGGTAPPALTGAMPGAPLAGSDRNLTIESLLAKMMQPGSD